MTKALMSLLTVLVFISTFGLADEDPPIQYWDNIDGVIVQPKERVDQINAYNKKLREAEKKKLKEGWEQEGITVQSEERVRHLNELEKKRREKEIREIKCEMCTIRCEIVRDAGQSMCSGSQTPSDTGLCKVKADNFFKTCVQQCELCQPGAPLN